MKVPASSASASTSQYWEPPPQKPVNSIISTGRAPMLAVLFLAFALSPQALAQYVDDHNPVGVTGIFNGNIATGCSYDPLTHSAHRAIDDIVVPGSVGKYPLKMTRYYNSRAVATSLGPEWRHEYLWSLGSYNGKIQYPNGNVWENHCESPVGVSDWTGPLDPYGNPTFRLADGGTVVFGWVFVNLRFPTAIIDPYGQTTTLSYNGGLLDRVTEPGGRYLQFTYNGPQTGLLSTVEAYDGQGHRIDWVVYHYDQERARNGDPPSVYCLTRVDYADSNPNNLSDDTHAHYAYEQDNVPDNQQRNSVKTLPLVSTCHDPRYKGPMRRIAYDYQDQGPHGAITAERYSPSDGKKGVAVSSIPGNLPGPLSGGQAFEMPRDFTETRGDGNVSRTFHYTRLKIARSPEPDGCPQIVLPNSDAPSQFLLNFTDFQGHTTWLGYDRGNNNEKWYVNSVTDARGTSEGDPNHTTTYTRGPAPPNGIGQILTITHPPAIPNGPRSSIQYTYELEPSPTPGVQAIQGHYLKSITDERGNKTIHTRHLNTYHITRTDYRDASNVLLAYETFDWCDQAGDPQCGNQAFGQLKTHRLKNGAYVHYRYDSRGLLIDKWEPTWTSSASESEPKTHYDYYGANDPVGGNAWIDRVKTVTGPPPNWPYSSQASETYEYDRVLGANGITNLSGAAVAGHGLVTKITHADSKFQRFAYDAYGNKRWEDNELRKVTTYVYDEYNRVLNITRPLNGITNYTYNPTNGSGSSYKHTTSNPDTVTVRTSAQTSITTRNVYDQNFRKTSATAADGTASAATTWFHYDPVGNQDYVTDPRGTGSGDPQYTTTTDYDNRNRKWHVWDAQLHRTMFGYDDANNIIRIDHPDGGWETKTYDGLNHVLTDTVLKSTGMTILTQFQYYPYNVQSASLLQKVIDGENHNYQFEYDPSGLKTKLTYHDGSYQTWAYDDAHNLKSRTTVARETQNFGYDNRNRKVLEWWDGLPTDAEWRAFDYDDAGHLTLATNGTGAYWTNFIADVRRSYDDAGRLTQDQQKVYVNGVGIIKNVNYPTHDDEGKLTHMYVDSASPAYDYTFSYDSMGRFEKIFATGQGNPYFQYYYDPASNERQRDSLFNQVLQIYPRDNLNRMQNLDLKKNGNTLGHEGYGYDEMSRLKSVTREDNKQDRFTYYKNGELNVATYGAAPTATPQPTPTPTAPPGQVVPPTFNPDGAVYAACAPSYDFNVRISTITSGARIRWTTDGSNWNEMANNGIAIFTVAANQTKTLQAYAYVGGTNSTVHSADYTFEHECAGQAPVASAATYPLNNAGNLPEAPDLVGTYTYSLDKAGNRTSVNGTSYSPNTINQYTSVGGSPVTNGNDHEISDYYGLHYTYMRDQELTKVTATGLTYDLAYDALGRCVKRTVNSTSTTYYFYDGEKPILEYNENNALVGFNLYGKGIDEIIERGAYGTDNQWHWYFLNQDHEGSVTHLTDASGNIIERYRYDAFGAPTIYAPNWTVRNTSSFNNRFLFTGREYAGAWVYEYRARVYHAYLGRFMSEDPKLFDASDYNLFRYCHNDPIDMTDPMGTELEREPGPTHAEQAKAESDRDYNYIMAAAQMNSSNGAIGVAALASTITTQLHASVMNYSEGAGLQTGVVPRGVGSPISDKPQTLVLNGEPVWDPYVNKWVVVPPRVSLDKNIAEAKSMSVLSWVKAVNQHGKWDYKDQGPYRDFGNINYGATGRALGYDTLTVHGGGFAYKLLHGTITAKDLTRDQYMIKTGIDYYNSQERY
jgi:RHS repeat-associated protein